MDRFRGRAEAECAAHGAASIGVETAQFTPSSLPPTSLDIKQLVSVPA